MSDPELSKHDQRGKALLLLESYLDRYLVTLDLAFLHPAVLHSSILFLIRQVYNRLQGRILRTSYVAKFVIKLPFPSGLSFEEQLIANRDDADYWWENGLRSRLVEEADRLEALLYKLYPNDNRPEVPDIDTLLPSSTPKLPDISWLISLAEAYRKTEKVIHDVKGLSISFNVQTSRLEFNNKKILISKTKDSDPHYLLTLLFEDKDRNWAYDELWDSPYFHSNSEVYDPKNDWRKIYNAGYSVNEKVAKATTINDFLIVKKTAISINRKYLE